MRRKQGTYLPIELSILEAGIALRQQGFDEFYGFLIASRIREQKDARFLTAYGTLYKALNRMEQAGLLESRWEDPLIAAEQQRPRRRFYRVTVAGAAVLASVQSQTDGEFEEPTGWAPA